MKKTVQIDIIAGFLGAGKTTLINKLLQEAYFGENIAVLENEFGAVGVDGGLLQREGIRVTEMTGGCICCSLKTTLTAGLVEICETFAPDRIIIEPTGLADIDDIAAPVADAAKDYPMEIGRIITVVNGANFSAQLDSGAALIRNQLEHTDLAVVSRAEKCDKKEIIRKAHEIREDLTIVTADWSKINGLTLLDLADRVGTHRPDGSLHEEGCTCGCCHGEDGNHHHHHHRTAGEYTCCSGETDRLFGEEDIRAIENRLSEGRGGDVFRAKGILRGKDQNWRFDYVDGEFSAEPHSSVSAGRYVFIGKEVDEDFWQSLMQ